MSTLIQIENKDVNDKKNSYPYNPGDVLSGYLADNKPSMVSMSISNSGTDDHNSLSTICLLTRLGGIFRALFLWFGIWYCYMCLRPFSTPSSIHFSSSSQYIKQKEGYMDKSSAFL